MHSSKAVGSLLAEFSSSDFDAKAWAMRALQGGDSDAAQRRLETAHGLVEAEVRTEVAAAKGSLTRQDGAAPERANFSPEVRAANGGGHSKLRHIRRSFGRGDPAVPPCPPPLTPQDQILRRRTLCGAPLGHTPTRAIANGNGPASENSSVQRIVMTPPPFVSNPRSSLKSVHTPPPPLPFNLRRGGTRPNALSRQVSLEMSPRRRPSSSNWVGRCLRGVCR